MVSERKQQKPTIWNLAPNTDLDIVAKLSIQKQVDQTHHPTMGENRTL